MVRIIEKKIWPDKFDEDKTLTLDFRLADFDLEIGDTIRFREWDPETENYTGREFRKVVKQRILCESPTRYWTPQQMEEHGMYLLQWEC
ncbi:MAG: DUF3850 domain-containing protein [Nanoarchaeota archaeon]